MLTHQDLGVPAPTGLEVVVGYIRWYFSISHSYILHQQVDVHIPRPPEQKSLDEVTDEEHGDQQWLDFRSRLARVRDHAFTIIFSGEEEEGSQIWMSLQGDSVGGSGRDCLSS